MSDPVPEPLAVDARGFAKLAGISRALVFKLDASGRCPAPVRIGRCVRWPVEAIKSWLDAGCPPRDAAAAERWRRRKAAELGAMGQKGDADA